MTISKELSVAMLKISVLLERHANMPVISADTMQTITKELAALNLTLATEPSANSHPVILPRLVSS